MLADKQSKILDPSKQRDGALARWENEGGAIHSRPRTSERARTSELTNADLVHLRVRVIALENLVLALLAGATGRQLDLAREMAGNITPRLGFTQHPLTMHAASKMIDLVERAGQFRPPTANKTR